MRLANAKFATTIIFMLVCVVMFRYTDSDNQTLDSIISTIKSDQQTRNRITFKLFPFTITSKTYIIL